MEGPPRGARRRLKVAVACETCRRRKVKCHGSNCPSQGHSATTGPSTKVRETRKRAVVSGHDSLSSQPETSSTPSFTQGAGHPAAAGSAPRNLASDINAAVTTRLGPPSAERPSLVPTSDVPLFGLLLRRPILGIGSHHHVFDSVLPPRKHADHLVDIYWRFIHPIEPLVDKHTFSESYQDLFAGDTLVDATEHVFLSTLNTVFALATQLQESLRPEEREEASRAYFHRAWALLRPETVVCEPGSLELVQCLLLASRYLQCTNNPHQTWMAVGTAIRIAQSLGLDVPEETSEQSKDVSRLRKQVWRCCVFIDRCTSWAFGRTSVLSLPAPVTSARAPQQEDDGSGGSPHYFTKTLELYEITNHIMLSQNPECNAFADELGLPRLQQAGDVFGIAMQIEGCFTQWKQRLDQELNLDEFGFDIVESLTNSVLYRQAVILRLRFLHGRIVLFKPMLARYCSAVIHTSPTEETTMPAGQDEGLKGRVLRDCAVLCLENAERMIALIQKEHSRGGNIGMVSWWHRVFYLHVAGTILIAAMLRADGLFTASASRSWDTAMMLLGAHAHLSPAVQQCVATFQTLSSKISETLRPPHAAPGPGGTTTTTTTTTIRHGAAALPASDGDAHTHIYFQDVFRDVGFDPSNSLFGVEDMAWLSNI